MPPTFRTLQCVLSCWHVLSSLCAIHTAGSVSNPPHPGHDLMHARGKPRSFWRGEMVFSTRGEGGLLFPHLHLGRKFPVADKTNPGQRPKLPWEACDAPQQNQEESMPLRSRDPRHLHCLLTRGIALHIVHCLSGFICPRPTRLDSTRRWK